MKKLLLLSTLASLLILGNPCFAQQVGISGTGAVPDPSSILDINVTGMSPKGGLLIPRLNTTERNAISGPAESLLIYNTTTQCYEGYNANTSTWVAFGCIGCTAPTAVTASASPNPICAGSTLTLTGAATNATAWNWTGPNGFTSTLQSPTISSITTAGAGIYTLAAGNTCAWAPGANTASVTITTLPVATFSYTGTPYCSTATNPSPTFSGGGVAGTFSSTAGLNFVSTATGQVNLATSTAGTYTVTNTIAASGGCGVVTATSSITITTLPVATFSYTGTPYCSNASNPSPTFSGGGVAGTFSSTAGLNFVSTATGQVNVATSTIGAYTVTNTIAAVGGCGVVTATSPITTTTCYPTVTGGTLASDATYYYRTFLADGTFGVSGGPLTCDVLVVAGGGGGGGYDSGGGGAGGVVSTSLSLNGSYSVTVGAGGTGGAGGSPVTGSTGGGSSISTASANGGGGGGGQGNNGASGGSGGGAGGAANTTGGSGSQGNAGGNAYSSWSYSGGGGGAGAVGENVVANTRSGNGGIGTSAYSSWATATSTGAGGYYAGGGGGGAASAGGGVGGSGGGGNANAGSATANTGGGGGGTNGIANGGNGGSGIVIVRYTRASVGG